MADDLKTIADAVVCESAMDQDSKLTPVDGEPGVWIDEAGCRYREWNGSVVVDPLGRRPEFVTETTRKPEGQH